VLKHAGACLRRDAFLTISSSFSRHGCVCVCMRAFIHVCVCVCVCVHPRLVPCPRDASAVRLLVMTSHIRCHRCAVQGAFLAEWDGLSTSNAAPVVVLGATNRPMDLDKGATLCSYLADLMFHSYLTPPILNHFPLTHPHSALLPSLTSSSPLPHSPSPHSPPPPPLPPHLSLTQRS
jgi:hypothetical protein